jgi:hypothetical protein
VFGLPTRHEVGLEMALHPGQQPSLETLPQPEAVLSDSRTQLSARDGEPFTRLRALAVGVMVGEAKLWCGGGSRQQR